MRTSTIYTIGTALTRAQGTGVSVDVLVAGQWLSGYVSALDGHGLVLHRNDGVLSVLRMESISAVQVRQAEAFEERPEVEPPARRTTRPDAGRCGRAGVRHGRTRARSPDGRRSCPSRDAVPLGRSMGRSPSGPVERPTVRPIVAPHSVPSEGCTP